jgi:DNA-binding transcriptional MocR family regulator
VPVQPPSPSRSAGALADRLERWIVGSRLAGYAGLPPVPDLAQALGATPGDLASAVRLLVRTGALIGSPDGRLWVSPLLADGAQSASPAPPGVRDLSTGNPDPGLLMPVEFVSAPEHLLYGEPRVIEEMRAAAHTYLGDQGLPGEPLVILPGGLEAIDRILSTLFEPTEGVIVEEPTYPGDLMLLSALGLRPVPVPVDDLGLLPEPLRAALPGASACLVRPRAQNPTGAALNAARAAELRQVFAGQDVTLIVEDHAGPVAGTGYESPVPSGHPRWLYVASVAKWLGPDMRFAMVVGDPDSVQRIDRRRLLGGGWVSRYLQAAVARALGDRRFPDVLRRAATEYAGRREALIAAVRERGFDAHGRSGMNVWIRVGHEERTVAELERAGWRVAPGRWFSSPYPAIRVTVAQLAGAELVPFAHALRVADDATAPGARRKAAGDVD